MKLVQSAIVAGLLLVGLMSGAAAQSVSTPLSRLNQPAATRENHATTVTFELSPREALAGVHLSLKKVLTPSAGVDDTQYAIWVNGVQQTTSKATTEPVDSISLPPQAFTPGINTVQVFATQPSEPIPASSALSREPSHQVLDMGGSSLDLDFAGLRANPQPTLAQLPIAFDHRALLPRTVAVVTGTQPAATAQLRVAATAIQLLARQMPETPFFVRRRSGQSTVERSAAAADWKLAPDISENTDVLLVGTRDQIAAYLPNDVRVAITHPFLGIYPAAAGRSVILVVSGSTDADVSMAVNGLRLPGARLPNASAMDVAAGAVADQQSGSPHSDAGLFPSHVSIYLPGRNTSTEESALNLASISAQRTGGVTDFDFESAASLKDVNANALVIGRADFLSSKDRALASLSAYSVAPHSDALFVTSDSASKAPAALLASDETSLAQAVETLRQLAHWRVAKTGPVTRFSADGEVTGLPRAIPAPAEQVAVLGLEPWQFAALLAVLAVTALWSITALLNEQQNKRLAGSEA